MKRVPYIAIITEQNDCPLMNIILTILTIEKLLGLILSNKRE